MTVCALVRDLMLASRILEAGERAGVPVQRLDSPALLPPSEGVSLVLVDWGDRDPGWAGELSDWRQRAPETARPRLVLFGPHTDLEAHQAAKAARLGPMWARSKLVAELPALLAAAAASSDTDLHQNSSETP